MPHMSTMIRVMAVDDHPLVREGLRLMLATSDDLVLVGDAADGGTALQHINEIHPDVILLDIRMSGMDGLEALVGQGQLEHGHHLVFCVIQFIHLPLAHR